MSLDYGPAIKSPSEVPCGLAFDGKSLWHADHGRQQIHQIDIASGEKLRTIDVPGTSCDTSYGDGLLWQAIPERQLIVGIDPSSGNVQRELQVPHKPYGVGWDGDALWVGAFPPDPTLLLIDARTGEIRKTTKAPTDTCGIEFALGMLWYTRKTKEVLAIDPHGGIENGRWPLDAKPGGLAWDGQRFWFVDQDSKSLRSFSRPGR